MKRLRQIFLVAECNFQSWHKNPRVFLVFALALILCYLLSDKAVRFSYLCGTTMQIFEPFVWTFGDSPSILLSSLLLILLFGDMPFLTASTPYYLVRIDRKTWLAGQLVYVFIGTFTYLLFLLLATSIVCVKQSFLGNVWSETAAILGYSGAGQDVALPALVRTLELSTPYRTVISIFVLMLQYALLLMSIFMLFRLRYGQSGGIAAVFSFSLYGFLLSPDLIKSIFNLSDEMIYKANVAAGWLSPLNHAAYHMHNFGYDLLPKLWQSHLLFYILILLCMILCFQAIRKYNFNFSAEEESV